MQDILCQQLINTKSHLHHLWKVISSCHRTVQSQENTPWQCRFHHQHVILEGNVVVIILLDGRTNDPLLSVVSCSFCLVVINWHCSCYGGILEGLLSLQNITNPVTPHDVIYQARMTYVRVQIRNWRALLHGRHFHSLGGSTTLSCVNEHRGLHFEIMTSHKKSDSVSRCVPNFIPIPFETTEH